MNTKINASLFQFSFENVFVFCIFQGSSYFLVTIFHKVTINFVFYIFELLWKIQSSHWYPIFLKFCSAFKFKATFTLNLICLGLHPVSILGKFTDANRGPVTRFEHQAWHGGLVAAWFRHKLWCRIRVVSIIPIIDSVSVRDMLMTWSAVLEGEADRCRWCSPWTLQVSF